MSHRKVFSQLHILERCLGAPLYVWLMVDHNEMPSNVRYKELDTVENVPNESLVDAFSNDRPRRHRRDKVRKSYGISLYHLVMAYWG